MSNSDAFPLMIVSIMDKSQRRSARPMIPRRLLASSLILAVAPDSRTVQKNGK
jgi:hypothetical protein